MAQILLTTKFVESVKGIDKRQEFSDSKSPNLVLLVQKSGTKSWVWRGRVDGKRKDITLGSFALHDLAAARMWSDGLTIKRDEGIDIVEDVAKTEDTEAWFSAFTCQRLFELYEKHDTNAKERWKKEKARIWNHDIKPEIGKKLVTKIDKVALMAVIRKKHETAPTSAIHIKNLLSRMFKWAVTEGSDLTRMENNPATNLVKLGKVTKRERVLSPYEIGLFFKALPMTESSMAEPTNVILYLGLRRDEAFGALWSEFALEKSEWLIPKERTKNEQPHMIPLPHELVTLFKARKLVTGGSNHVWPSSRGDRQMTGFSDWMELLIEKMRFVATKDGKEVPHFTLHDLRRTLSTGMNGLRDGKKRLVGKDIVERVLNHKIAGVEGVYDRYDYYEDKENALRHWAGYLQSIKDLHEVDKLPAPLLQLPAPTNDELSVAAA